MIAFLHGRLAARGPDWVHVDVGGVGYMVFVPATSQLPAVGQEVRLLTTLRVKEDELVLYGFSREEDQKLFDLCCGVAGVGPRTALALLSALPPERLRQAVVTEDIAALTAVPGVGKKTAQRLVLELGDKLGAAAEVAAAVPAGSSDAVAALVGLGYSTAEAIAAVAAAERDGGGDTAELVRRALRSLGGSRG